MKKIIGKFEKCNHDTYAECARITLSCYNEYGKFFAEIEDGILYISELTEKDTYRIVSANSTFDLSVNYN